MSKPVTLDAAAEEEFAAAEAWYEDALDSASIFWPLTARVARWSEAA